MFVLQLWKRFIMGWIALGNQPVPPASKSAQIPLLAATVWFDHNRFESKTLRWVNTFWVCNHFKTENGQNRQTVVVPFLLGLRNTYLTVNSLSYFSNIVKVFWISFHILCSFSKFRGFGRFSFFVFATFSKYWGPSPFHFNEFPFYREKTSNLKNLEFPF